MNQGSSVLMTPLWDASSVTARGQKRRSIWRHSGLVLFVLGIPGLWLGFMYAIARHGEDAPPHRSKYDFAPPPPNAVSTYLLNTKSGRTELTRLIVEKDWETACVIAEEDDPLFALKTQFNMRVTFTVEPPLDEEWKDHLWKIAVVKDREVSVYYLDNRRIGRLSRASCLPLERASLSFKPYEDRIFVELIDKESPRE